MKQKNKRVELLAFFYPNTMKIVIFIALSFIIYFFVPLYSCTNIIDAIGGTTRQFTTTETLFHTRLPQYCDLSFFPVYNIVIPYLFACLLAYLVFKSKVFK